MVDAPGGGIAAYDADDSPIFFYATDEATETALAETLKFDSGSDGEIVIGDEEIDSGSGGGTTHLPL